MAEPAVENVNNRSFESQGSESSNLRVFRRERLQAIRQSRGVASGVASLEDEKPEVDQSQEDTSDLNPRGLRNRLDADRKASKEFRKKAEEAVKARLRALALKYAGKIGLRVVNILLGSTGVGLIIVFFVMLYQGFFGNLLSLPGVTKLSGLEQLILLGLGVLMFALYIFFIMTVSLFSDPWSTGIQAIKESIESLFD